MSKLNISLTDIEEKDLKKYVNQIDEINYISIILKSYCDNNANTEEERAIKTVVDILWSKSGDLIADILDKYSDFIDD